MAKRRSGGDGFAIGDLFGGVDECTKVGRVGGRQSGGPRQTGGGGYLKNCGSPNFRIADIPPPDPRFRELEQIRIPGAWLRLARRIGFDAFLDVWRMISNDEATRHDGGHRLPKIREYRSYERLQRNNYIRSLAASGMKPAEIRKMVLKNLGELMDLQNIQRIIQGKYGYNQPD